MIKATEGKDLWCLLVEYFADILTATNEEEILTIKQEMSTYLKENGVEQTIINSFFTKADEMVEKNKKEGNFSIGSMVKLSALILEKAILNKNINNDNENKLSH